MLIIFEVGNLNRRVLALECALTRVLNATIHLFTTVLYCVLKFRMCVKQCFKNKALLLIGDF